MRKLVPIYVLALLAALGLAAESRAETRGSHAPDETAVVKAQPKSQPVSQPTSPVSVLTRQDALIRGIREAGLSPQGMKALIKATENQPKLDADKFGKVVNDLAQKQKAITPEQAEKLQTLFTSELGSVLDSPVGTELNLATKRVLDGTEGAGGQTTTPPAIGKQDGAADAKNPLAGDPTAAAGAANPLAANALDGILGNKFSQLDSQFGGAKAGAEDPNSLASKQFALTQNLLKNLDERRERRKSRDRDQGLGGGLLEALRGAFGDQKSDNGGNNGFTPKDFKDAFSHSKLPEPPKRGGDDKDKDKKSEITRPEPRRGGDEDRDRGAGALAALLKGKDGNGNGNGNNKGENDKKGEDKFQLPEPKTPKEGAATSKKATPPSVDKQEPLDPSQMMDPKDLAEGPPPPQTSPLQGISPSGMGGGFGGDFGGFSGGGGSMGPNIIGSASAPAGGGFDGDPFSGLGGGFGDGGGPPGGYQFSKPVAYGGTGGGSAEGGDGDADGGGGDFETPYASAAGRSSASASSGRSVVLVLSPSDDSKKSLLDYFGKLRSTLCGGEPGGVAVEVCKKVESRRYIRALRQAEIK